MEDYFLWYKAVHVIAVISWMAAMLYMPRLFVYHTSAEVGSDMDKMFQTMEIRLLRVIMNPAMIITYIFGLLIAYIYGMEALGVWFHVKMLVVAGLTVFHGFLAKWRKDFAQGNNKHSEKFYRLVNEVPTFLMVVAVIMVIVKPFE
ncbi:MAG: protoporphyrinogen oxidase HemJ [Rickettsiaceae bacterium]